MKAFKVTPGERLQSSQGPVVVASAKAYRIQAEAVGGTKEEALAYLLRVAASLVEGPNARGHTCRGTGGNANARIEAIR